MRSHLEGIKHLTENLDADDFFNIDMVNIDITLIWCKNVDGATTGHEKSRFTVAVTTSASGRMLKGYLKV